MKKSASKHNFVESSTETLKKHGYRLTKTRRLVAENVGKHIGPFGPKDIHDQIQEAGEQSLDFATVYRTLLTYSELALIHQVSPSGKFVVCNNTHAANQTVHMIYRCESCHEVKERGFAQEVSVMLFELAKKMGDGFEVNSSVLEITGLCRQCNETGS